MSEKKDSLKHQKDIGKKNGQHAIDVREMELEDLAPVFDLGEKLFTSEAWPNLYRTWDDYELIEMFAADREMCLVAELDDTIVGFVLGTIIEKRRSPWTYGYVVWLGVSPQHAGMGIGKRLVESLIDIFIENGARIVLADTDAKNLPAIRFFDRMGFDSKRDHVYMARNLADHPAYLRRKRALERQKAAAQARNRLREKLRGKGTKEKKKNGKRSS